MNSTFADYAFGNRKNRQPKGIACLNKDELRQTLDRDTQHWMDTGHCIEQLPPGPESAAGHFDTFSSLLIETGYYHEL